MLTKEELLGTYLEYSEEITEEVWDKIVKHLEAQGFERVIKYTPAKDRILKIYPDYEFGWRDVSYLKGKQIQLSDLIDINIEKELTVDDLVEGEIYHWISKHHNSDWIGRCTHSNKGWVNSKINLTNSHFQSGEGYLDPPRYIIKKATPHQNKWLRVCEKYGEFVSESELDKYDDETFELRKSSKTKFEIGKWYKLTDCPNSYRKCKDIPTKDVLLYSDRIEDGNFGYNTGTLYCYGLDRLKEVSLEEIQQYLPDGHVDKFPKESNCETCGGTGEVMEGRLYPSGHTEVQEECPDCDGTGVIIEDHKSSKSEFKHGELLYGTTNNRKEWLFFFNSQGRKVDSCLSVYRFPRNEEDSEYFNNTSLGTVCGGRTKNIRKATQEDLDRLKALGYTTKDYKFVKLEESNPVFEYGKWYKNPTSKWLCYYRDRNSGYGFTHDGSWFNFEKRRTEDVYTYPQATEEEVKDRILRYAKEKYPVGTKYRCIVINEDVCEVRHTYYYFSPRLTTLLDSDIGYLFDNGKWAEVIKKPIVEDNNKITEKMNTHGLAVGDVLPVEIINAWSDKGKHYYYENWVRGLGTFMGDRHIERFEILHGIVGFQVSGTDSVYLKAEGFKEFMDNFYKEDSFRFPKNMIGERIKKVTISKLNLENTKIWIGDNPELSRLVQERLFNLGYAWKTGEKKVQYTRKRALYINHRIAYGSDREDFVKHLNKEIFPSDLGIEGYNQWKIVSSLDWGYDTNIEENPFKVKKLDYKDIY